MLTADYDERDYDRVEQLIEYMHENFRDQPTLADLAAHLNLSEYHLQRMFRRWAGISPKRFLQYLTAEYARDRLQASRDILDTVYAAGLSGPGRLHDLTLNIYAMTPSEVKEQGRGLAIAYGFHATLFGDCLLGLTGRGVCALRFVSLDGRQAALGELRAEWPNASFEHDPAATGPIIEQIFGATAEQSISLFVKGTNFQVRVWEALLTIPQGALVTYGDIAQRIDRPNASRAVGSAVGSNPIGYLIPCHRVIRSNGIVGDYRWSASRKQAMIAWEAERLQPAELLS
ncbi:MAG: methylated-DNA--[protein]-cysteine S-methyltransferase [Chloroflexi bacterium]|nr:methylated-DNA--[protein]-cysteine S-methyltransferase [Chloroflexota bacterium]